MSAEPLPTAEVAATPDGAEQWPTFRKQEYCNLTYDTYPGTHGNFATIQPSQWTSFAARPSQQSQSQSQQHQQPYACTAAGIQGRLFSTPHGRQALAQQYAQRNSGSPNKVPVSRETVCPACATASQVACLWP